NYHRVSTLAASEDTRKRQRLLMGPWGHAVNTTSMIGDIEFGPSALINLQERMIDWLDWALGRREHLDTSPVRIFVMGENRWRDETEWPLARTVFTDYFFHSKGRANTREGDGVLSTESPKDEP